MVTTVEQNEKHNITTGFKKRKAEKVGAAIPQLIDNKWQHMERQLSAPQRNQILLKESKDDSQIKNDVSYRNYQTIRSDTCKCHAADESIHCASSPSYDTINANNGHLLCNNLIRYQQVGYYNSIVTKVTWTTSGNLQMYCIPHECKLKSFLIGQRSLIQT